MVNVPAGTPTMVDVGTVVMSLEPDADAPGLLDEPLGGIGCHLSGLVGDRGERTGEREAPVPLVELPGHRRAAVKAEVDALEGQDPGGLHEPAPPGKALAEDEQLALPPASTGCGHLHDDLPA